MNRLLLGIGATVGVFIAIGAVESNLQHPVNPDKVFCASFPAEHGSLEHAQSTIRTWTAQLPKVDPILRNKGANLRYAILTHNGEGERKWYLGTYLQCNPTAGVTSGHDSHTGRNRANSGLLARTEQAGDNSRIAPPPPSGGNGYKAIIKTIIP